MCIPIILFPDSFLFYVPYTRLLGQVDADELKYKTFLKRLAPIYFIELSAFIYHPDWNPLNIKPLKHDIYFTEFHFMLHSHNYFPRPQNSLAFWPRSHFSKTKINLWPEMWCLVTQDFVTSCVTTRRNVLQFLEQGITDRSGYGDTGILGR